MEGRLRWRYQAAQTPLARVLSSDAVSAQTKARLRADKARQNPFELREKIERELKSIEQLRRQNA